MTPQGANPDRKAESIMREIGINLHAAKGFTDEEYLREIAGLGFTRIFTGVMNPERQASVAEYCAKYGIVCETLHAPFGHMNDIWLDNEGGPVMLDELLHCIDHCVIAGAGIAVIHLSSGMKPPSITDIGRERFTRLVEYATEKGVKIAFENQRKLANLAWAFEAFPDDNVGFCWDCGHEFCFTPGRHYMPLFGDRLICTHIHDNTAVFNEDTHVLPFDSACDFDYVAGAIRDSGYTGSLMLEVGCSAFYGDMAPLTFLERAAESVKRLRTMIDGE